MEIPAGRNGATPHGRTESAPHRGSEDYVVSLRGCLGTGLLDAFAPLVATTSSGRTVLRGPVADQAELHGIFAKIQNLGLELDEVRHADDRLLP